MTKITITFELNNEQINELTTGLTPHMTTSEALDTMENNGIIIDDIYRAHVQDELIEQLIKLS